MWLKNGVKRFFEIALVTLFLFFLLGNLPYARAQEQEWHWGLENCTLGACPEGLVGPFFFQFGNKWASNKEVKFEGWESEEKLGQAWCFSGSIATIILYHEYPRESRFDGVWLSDKNVRIDHEWKYADIKNLVGGIDCWYQDNPETRVIPGCKIDGYCKAADEIRRLFGAITAALRFTEGYSPIFDYPDECIPDMMRDYFGYLSDVIVLPPNATTLNEENKLKLIQSLNNGYPVIVVGDGHAWVLDGYRDDNGDEFHTLNFGCVDSHKSYWTRDPVYDGRRYSAKAFIINLRPEVVSPPVIVNDKVDFVVKRSKFDSTVKQTPILPTGTSGESNLLGPGGVLDQLYRLKNLIRIDNDQIWTNLDGGATAKAMYTGRNEQTLCYIDANNVFQQIFTETGNGFGVSCSGTIPGKNILPTFRWGLISAGHTWSSQPSDNSDKADHMVTWLIKSGPSAGNFVIAWEDFDCLGDKDYQDLVVEIDTVSTLTGQIGTFTITAELTNTSVEKIDIYEPVKAVVNTLEYTDDVLGQFPLILFSATEGDGTKGSKQTIDVGEGVLIPDESITVDLVIGLSVRSRFSFLVDVEGSL